MATNGEHKGMMRRASASSTTIPPSVSSSTTRVHRTNESHHGFVGMHPTNAGPAAYTPANASGTPQYKVVLALIKRLTAKLPCYSGLSLTDIESDSAVQLIVESLVGLAKHALDIIVWKLSEELERLAKLDTSGQRSALDVLQSEVFLLKVMSVTLAYRWQHRDKHSKRSHSSIGHTNGTYVNGNTASPAPSPSLTSLPKSSKRSIPSFGIGLNERMSNGPLWLEPQPLDEACARWLVSVILLLLRQSAPRDDRTKAYSSLSPDANLYCFESVSAEDGIRRGPDVPWVTPSDGGSGEPSPSVNPGSHWPRKTPSLNSLSSGATSQMPLPRNALGFQPTPRTLTTSSLPLYSLITEWTAKIVYLLSAANWSVVLWRIRGKIHQLARTSPSEEFLDYTDLQLLQYCAMDRSRLQHILQELSSLLVNMKRDSQVAVAQSIHKAIWNWIETFPAEYSEICSGQRKLDGAPERVFDLLFQICDDGNRKAMWPTLHSLLVLSYDRTKIMATLWERDTVGLQKQQKKELLFLDQVKKNLDPSSKVTETAILCHVDFLRAASFSSPPNPSLENDVPIRIFGPEVADDLKSRLWKAQGQRPFFESTDPIDVSLYADALVGLMHFIPEEEFVQLMSACLEPERSEAVKLVAVKAYITILQQAAKWPWLKAIVPLSVKGRVKVLLTTAVTRYNEVDGHGVVRRSAARPASKRFSSEAIPDRELLILAILALYRMDAGFFLDDEDDAAALKRLQDTATLIRNPGDPAIPLASLRTFGRAADWILTLQPGDEYYERGRRFLGYVIPIVLQAASCRLLDARDVFDEQRVSVEIALAWVNIYARCVDSDLSSSWDFSTGRLPAMMVTEIAFLVTLTSADTSVSILAARGLRELALAECGPNPQRLVEEPDEAAKRYPMYQQLGDPSVVLVGRVAQQKRVRKLLRLMKNPCPLHAAVWHECYWRWSSLKDWIMRPVSSVDSTPTDGQNGFKPTGDLTMTSEEKFYQWQNLTWFLSSFGAISVMEDCGTHALTKLIPAQFVPDRFRIPQDGGQMLQDFMSSSVEVLIADNLVARDTAKEALGSELHPRMYSRLFKHLNEVVEDISRQARESPANNSPEEEEFLHVFFDQFLTVLKLLVERPDSPSEEVLGNMDLNQTLLLMTKFIDRINAASSSRLKVKFCNFCESAFNPGDSLGLRKDDFVRNNLLDVVVEWIESENVAHDEYELLRLRHETNVASLLSMVRLLERLRLQPLDVSAGDDASHVVSRRYLRYQNVLLRALDSNAVGSVASDDDLTFQHPTSNQRKAFPENDIDLRDYVITGLAYLLSANTDIGLKHFLPLGYDSDTRKRTIFCRVISRVMDLGGKIEQHNDSVVATRRLRIGELVKGSDMILVLAICETCPPSEVDVIIPVLLNLFDTRASLLSLLKLLIEREVKTTESEVGLFRGNSMRIKLLCAFAKLHGYDYLRQIVKPLIDKMCSLPVPHSFILDPAKAQEQEIHQNQETIKALTQAFLQIVIHSAPAMPLMLREICAHISQTVAEVWPDSKFAALGAFIFLRFISPALVSPETIDIELPQDNVSIRRGLLVVTKIIQNLANNVRFGKEAHMMYFNDFLQMNIVRVMRFLTDVNKFASVPTEDTDDWLGGNFDETDAIVLHRFFEKHADKVGKELLSLSKSSKEGEGGVIGGKKAWDTLCAALVDMGQPVDIPRLSPLKSTIFEDYRNFMNRNADRNVEPVRKLFTEMAVTKDDVVLYRLAIWKFDIEVLDFELLVYYVFKTLMSPGVDSKSFEIVLDCSNYTTASEIPMQWFKFFVELIPSDLRERFRTAHVLNCNQHTIRFLRKLYNICAGVFIVDIRSYLSVSDLCGALQVDVTSSLADAWSLEQEEKESFKDVMLRQAHLMKVSINLAVAQSHLRIDSVKAQLVFPQFSSRTTEIVPYADIGDVYNVSTGRDANEFIVRRSRNGGTLYFSSPKRELIVKAIRAAKSRMNVSRTIFFDRFSRLSNISAALLNIAMFNTYHDSADLRSAAYNLLSAVCSSLNYDGESFLPSSGGFIPGRPVTIVTQLSEKLAAFAPELTLDFISQVCLELDKSAIHQKAICLQYMNPWIKNLNKFCDPTHKLYELSGARLRDCVRLLIELTVRDSEAYYIMQRFTWYEIGRLDSVVVNVVLDEIMRAAVDGGLGSSRCEVMADTLSSMSSVNARGRILAKLRKALGKTTTTPSKSLEKNVHWNEIIAYSRLALGCGLSSQHPIHCQILVPEVVHLVTLLASQGDISVRNTIYGLALQLFQSLYVVHADDASLSSEIRTLLQELTQPDIIRLFGLTQKSASSEYEVHNSPDEQNSLEGLSRWLLKAITKCAGNTGLINIWRARWMGLLTSTAFQLSPSVQPRAFVVLGTLASSDVDDDLLYQMLVALHAAMKTADESDTACVVSMLHCVCSAVPSLPESSRYIGSLFWLAVALLQSSHAPFYKEANSLLCTCITTLNRQGAFRERGFTVTLLDARTNLDDISLQLDQLLGLSFDSDFSFSLAAVIFKGIRRQNLRSSATEALRCLLTTSVSTFVPPSSPDAPIHPDALGYFLALLPVSTTPHSYQQLLHESGIGSGWVPKKDPFRRIEDDEDQVPRVPFEVLGCQDQTTALLTISFLGTMLSSAQSDDAESQMLFGILKDASAVYPDVISLAYDGLQEKIHDIFMTSSNPSILSSVGTIFRDAMDDTARSVAAKGSSSTLSTLDEDTAYGQKQLHALEELSMQGLVNTFQFLPPNRGHVTKVLKWFPELITKIIE